MKTLLLAAGAAAILTAQSYAQAQAPQTQNEMTVQEFRQVLMDLAAYLDAHKGTDLQTRFTVAPDDILSQLQSAVPNVRQLQKSVAALKEQDSMRLSTHAGSAGAMSASPMMTRFHPESNTPGSSSPYPNCAPNTIIDTSAGAACTPSYPDPSNTAWQSLVNPLITFGAFSGLSSNTDYADVSPQACGLTVESNLSQTASALQGTVLAASAICSALPPIASNVCWGVNAAFSIASAVSFGLFADCTEQDGNVNAAEIDAGFHNTVTIYNALNSGLAGIGTSLTNVNSSVSNVNSNVSNANAALTTLTNNVSNGFSAQSTQLSNVNNQITSEFGTLDSHVASEILNAAAQLTSLINQLSNQVSQGTALSDAELRQVMKLLLEPDGLKKINPAILTCTGSNCPNVLAACPAAGCSWNNIGPLP